MKSQRAKLLTLLLFLGACGGPPAPGDRAYPFNVEGSYAGTISVEGEGFAVVAQFFTDVGGAVSGTFRVTQPVQISGIIQGTLVGAEAEIVMDYQDNPMSGCDGTVSGTVSITEGGSTIRGAMTVTDCGDVLQGNMVLNRTS